MTDFNTPALTDVYADFLTLLKARDVDIATMFNSAPTNTPANAVRYNRSTNTFQEFTTVWADLILAVAGGGTGSATAGGARTNLGLGTMSTQASNAVSITGGTVEPTTFNAKGNIAVDADATYDLGSNAKKIKRGYFSDGLVIPVGVNKWISS